MLELTVTLGWAAWLLVIGAAAVFGIVAHLTGEVRTGVEWLIDGVAFAVGAVAFSEVVVAFREVGPVWDGLALVPAIAGGLVVGVVVEVLTRFLTGGTYGTHQPMSA